MQSFGKAFLAMSLEVEGVFQTAAMRLKRTVGLMPAFWCLFFFQEKRRLGLDIHCTFVGGNECEAVLRPFRFSFLEKKETFLPSLLPPTLSRTTSHRHRPHLPSPPPSLADRQPLRGAEGPRRIRGHLRVAAPPAQSFFFGCRGGWVGRWV